MAKFVCCEVIPVCRRRAISTPISYLLQRRSDALGIIACYLILLLPQFAGGLTIHFIHILFYSIFLSFLLRENDITFTMLCRKYIVEPYFLKKTFISRIPISSLSKAWMFSLHISVCFQFFLIISSYWPMMMSFIKK